MTRVQSERKNEFGPNGDDDGETLVEMTETKKNTRAHAPQDGRTLLTTERDAYGFREADASGIRCTMATTRLNRLEKKIKLRYHGCSGRSERAHARARGMTARAPFGRGLDEGTRRSRPPASVHSRISFSWCHHRSPPKRFKPIGILTSKQKVNDVGTGVKQLRPS